MNFFIKHLTHLIHQDQARYREIVWLFADAAAAFVTLVGLISLGGYVFGLNFLHDGWVKNSPDMSFQTAVCFALLGFSLLAIHRHQPEE
jgi:succinate dehydrogenase hydrophobic anchor subunit